jgi:hypothetical protein
MAEGQSHGLNDVKTAILRIKREHNLAYCVPRIEDRVTVVVLLFPWICMQGSEPSMVQSEPQVGDQSLALWYPTSASSLNAESIFSRVKSVRMQSIFTMRATASSAVTDGCSLDPWVILACTPSQKIVF